MRFACDDDDDDDDEEGKSTNTPNKKWGSASERTFKISFFSARVFSIQSKILYILYIPINLIIYYMSIKYARDLNQ